MSTLVGRSQAGAAAEDLATVVISVYRDVTALRCILGGLRQQTHRPFQIIVSEDGKDPLVRQFVQAIQAEFPNLLHLTQEDCGFRKTMALNRAVGAATADRLIFIDGDCVPHRRLVENHLRYAEPKTVCVGRRVQMGPRFSHWLRNGPSRIRFLQHPVGYLMLAPLLFLDGVRNYEVGLVSSTLQSLHGGARRFILGCNFSCSKQDLVSINGFNEDFVHPGVGEDTDLEWRFERMGVRLKNLRFLAPVFHLYHESSWTASQENRRILDTTRERDEVYCRRGIQKMTALREGPRPLRSTLSST